jgi:hypothetical protein
VRLMPSTSWAACWRRRRNSASRTDNVAARSPPSPPARASVSMASSRSIAYFAPVSCTTVASARSPPSGLAIVPSSAITIWLGSSSDSVIGAPASASNGTFIDSRPSARSFLRRNDST